MCVFNSIPLINVSVFTPVSCCFFVTVALYYKLKSGMAISRVVFLLFSLVSAIMAFCVAVWILRLFSTSMKNQVRILLVAALNIQIAFGRTSIFTTLILSIHDLLKQCYFLYSCSFSIDLLLSLIKALPLFPSALYTPCIAFISLVPSYVVSFYFLGSCRYFR